MTSYRALLASAVLAAGLSGCDVLAPIFGADDLALLGVMPAAEHADPASEDAGKVTFAVTAMDDVGWAFAPARSMLKVEDEDGEEVIIDDTEPVPGHDQGSFVLLVDGTGSMEGTGLGCEGCPTDPERHRVAAAQILTEQLAACGPDWRQSLMEFSTDVTGGDFDHTRVLADYGSEPTEIADAANALQSTGGTPVWDATAEVLESLLVDTEQELFGRVGEGDPNDVPPSEGGDDEDQAGDREPSEWGQALVVISDGADTSSSMSVDALIARALEVGVPIHTIGLGPASDGFIEFSAQPDAIADLRRLADETGGYYGYVDSADQLPALASDIALAVCGGYSEVHATFAETRSAGERVNGRIRLRNTPVSLPYTFTVP